MTAKNEPLICADERSFVFFGTSSKRETGADESSALHGEALDKWRADLRVRRFGLRSLTCDQ